MNLTALCPKDEEIWVTYYKKNELLFFLTGPAGMPSTLAAQSGKFTLYGVSTGTRGAQKAKKTRPRWKPDRAGSEIQRGGKDERIGKYLQDRYIVKNGSCARTHVL